MDIKEFNPYVRFCSAVWLHSDYQKIATAYDFRLFFVISGGFTAQFEEKSMEVHEGDLLIIPPGTPYRHTLSKYEKSNHIIVNFDFVSRNLGTPTKTAFEPDAFHTEEIYATEHLPPFSKVFHRRNAFSSYEILKKMCDEKKSGHYHSDEVLSAMMKLLLSLIARDATESEGRPESEASRLCTHVTEYIKRNSAAPIDNGTVAKHFGYHPYYLNAILKRMTGMTLHDHIIEKRLEMAKEMLLSTNKSISEVGQLCGFSGASYFTECFKSRVGVTPSDYRGRAK